MKKTATVVRMGLLKINTQFQKFRESFSSIPSYIKKNKRKTLLFSFLSCIFIVTFAYFLMSPAKKAFADWFNDNWLYRTPYTITNSGIGQTDSYVKLDINTASLISSGKLRSACQDSRFIDQTGKPLPFYISSGGGGSAGSISYDGSDSSTSTGSGTGTTTYSYSHTVPAGNSDRMLVVSFSGLDINTASSNDYVEALTVTYNGKLLSKQISNEHSASNRTYSTEIWTLTNPDTGTNTLAVELSDSNMDEIVITAMNFSGVDQYDPFGARGSNWANNSSVDVALTTEADNSVIVSAGYARNDNSPQTPDISTGTTVYQINTGGSGTQTIYAAGGYQAAASAGSHTATLSTSSDSTPRTLAALEIKPTQGLTPNIQLTDRTMFNTTTGVGSTSISHTVTSGSNKMLAVMINGMVVGVGADTVDFDGSNVTFDGTAMTRSVFVDNGASDRRLATEIWTLKNPSVGTKTLHFEFTGATPQEQVVGAFTFDGVDQTTGVGTTASNSSNNSSETDIAVSLTPSTAYSFLLGSGAARTQGTSDYDNLFFTSGDSYYNWQSASADNVYMDASGGVIYAPAITSYTMTLDKANDATINLPNIAAIELITAATPAGVGDPCDDASTDYYVLLPTLIAGNSTIYHYYGNATAVSTAGSQFAQSEASTYSVSAGSEAQSPGPASYWKFDEGTDTTAEDATASNKDGTLTNGPTWKEGFQCVRGDCLQFDGSDDFVDVGAASSTVKTVSFWVYPITTSEHMFDLNGTAYISASSGTVSASGFTTPTIYVNGIVGTTIEANKWQQITVTTGTAINASDLDIGRVEGSGNFEGFIDEPKIYEYARSAAEVKTEYLAQAGPHGSGTTLGASDDIGMKNGLVGYWPLDETSANTCADGVEDACDYSGNSNDGDWTNATSTATARFGHAMVMDGNTDYVLVDDSNSLDASSAVSFGAWVKLDAVVASQTQSFPMIMEKGNSAAVDRDYGMYIDKSGDSLICSGRNQADDANALGYSVASASTYLNDLRWHHVFCTYDGRQTRILIDGKPIDGTDSSTGGTMQTSTSNLAIGAAGQGSYSINAKIDEARVYNRALSPAEIERLYNWGPTPIAYWNLDENSGTSPTTGSVDVSIAASSDDAEEPHSGGATDLTSSDLEITYDEFSLSQIVGLRFVGITVPNSAIISNAFIQFSVDNDTLDMTGADSAYIFGEATDDAVTFSTAVGDISSRSVTSSTVPWTSIPSWTYPATGADQKSPDISTVIQEIVDRDGWTSGNDMVIMIDGTNTTYRIAQSFDTGVGATVPQLTFDYASGPTAYAHDTTGKGNTGTLTNFFTDAWTPGKYGSALEFDGSSTSIIVPDNPLFDGDPRSFTYEAWIKVPTNISAGSGTIRSIFSKYITSGNEPRLDVALIKSTGVVNFVVESSTNTDTTGMQGVTDLRDNQWHHIAAVRDRDRDIMMVYVDGKVDISATDGDQDASNNGSLYIGDYGLLPANGRTFLGKIDEAKVYDYARTQAQVIEDMNGGHPVGGSPVGSQIGYWKFDEGYGTTANNEIEGNSNLTLSTASWTTNGKYGVAWNGSGSGYRLSMGSDDDTFDFDGTDDFSISLWAKSDSASNPSGDQFLVDKEAGIGYGLYFNNSGQLVFGIDDDVTWSPDDTVTSTTDLFDGSWHYILARKTGASRIDLFIDGALNASKTALTATGTLANSDTLTVGDQDTTAGNEFAGDIDELKIYRAALTTAQMSIDFNQGKAIALGAKSTASDGTTATNSRDRSYCVPGDSTSCSAPVGEWLLDENTGTSTTYDTSGNGQNGTLTSITESSWRPGKKGSALRLDGSADYVDIGTGPSSVKTISFWVYPETTTEYFINLTSTTDYIWLNAGTLTATGLATPTYYVNGIQTNAMVAKKWQYVTVTTATAENASNFDIGRSQNANYLEGKIDQIRLYDYVRTPAQIAWEMNKGAPRVWYRFDTCQGTTAYNATSDGNGQHLAYDGTIQFASNGYTAAGTCSSGTSTEMWNQGTTGKINASLAFDGSDDYVDIGDLGFDMNAISFWIYPSSGTDSWFDFDGGTHTITVSSGTITAGGWSSPTIYVNGVRSTSISTDTWSHVSVISDTAFDANNVDFGRVSTTYFQGQLDDLRIFSYPLSAAQVRTVYNNGAVSFK